MAHTHTHTHRLQLETRFLPVEVVSHTITEVDIIHIHVHVETETETEQMPPIILYMHIIVNTNYCILGTVGKLRRRWMNATLGPVAMDMLKAVKKNVDPQNIFGCGNLLP